MTDCCHAKDDGAQVKVLRHRRCMIVFNMQFGGSVHSRDAVRGYTGPLVESIREVAGHQQQGKPDDIDNVVGNDREPELRL